jgi:cytochrome b
LSCVRDATQRTVKVWDPLVRAGHWLLVACIAVSWATGEGGEG